MTTVTADDIQVLAQTEGDAVLAVVDGDLRVLDRGDDFSGATVIYRKSDLLAEYGEEITDMEAEMLAAGLTANLAVEEGGAG